MCNGCFALKEDLLDFMSRLGINLVFALTSAGKVKIDMTCLEGCDSHFWNV